MNFLHINRILHRDIKLDNILLNDKENCKICDFGVSRFFDKFEESKEKCGTPAYLAPEIIKGNGYSGFSVDIWSLGVLLFSLLVGKMPFKGDSIDVLNKEILKGLFSFEDFDSESIKGNQIGIGVNYGKLENFEKCEKNLNFDNKKNESFEKINLKILKEKSKISEEAKDLIKKMLVLDPTKRIKISGILRHKFFDNFDTKTETFLKIEEFENKKNSYLEEEKFKIDEFVLDHVCSLGFTREVVIDSVKNGKFDHAAACYFTLENDFN